MFKRIKERIKKTIPDTEKDIESLMKKRKTTNLFCWFYTGVDALFFVSIIHFTYNFATISAFLSSHVELLTFDYIPVLLTFLAFIMISSIIFIMLFIITIATIRQRDVLDLIIMFKKERINEQVQMQEMWNYNK